MSTSSEPPRPRRGKQKLTEKALANRLAATLDPKIVEAAAAAPAGPAPNVEPSTAKAPDPPEARLQEAKTPAGPPVRAMAGGLFGRGVDRFTGAVSSAQEIARDTARSLAGTPLQAAQSIVLFQTKLLEMVHANLHQGFAAAQKMVTAPNMGEAIRVQSRFATGQVKALSDQAAELRSLSAQLAKEAQQPWTSHMAKSLERVKSSLGA